MSLNTEPRVFHAVPCPTTHCTGLDPSEAALLLVKEPDVLASLNCSLEEVLVLARIIEAAACDLDIEVKKSSLEWFGWEFKSSWKSGEQMSRSKSKIVSKNNFDCEVEGVQVQIRASFVLVLREADGWERQRLKQYEVQCQAQIIGGGSTGSGMSGLKADEAGCTKRELMSLAWRTLHQSTESALLVLKATPEFEPARQAACEARSIQESVGTAKKPRRASVRI